MSLASLLLPLLLPVVQAQDTGPDWLLVRGKEDGYAQLGLDRIGDVYLGRGKWKLVGSDDAGSHPASHRLLIGTPEGNAALRALLAKLGADLADGIRYGGRKLESGQGLAIVTDDPDGKGRLVLFTGLDATGVAACLSVPVDLGRKGYTIARWQVVLHRELEGLKAPVAGLERPIVVRLDRDFDHLAAAATGGPADRALRVARGLVGYGAVYEAAYGPRVDMQRLMAEALADGKPAIDAARRRFAEVDLDRRLVELCDMCTARLGGVEGPRPVYYVLYGHPTGTNARTFGDDKVTGRRQVLLNLCRFGDVAELEVATLHETVHCLQGSIGRTLAERVVAEGVATAISKALRPGTTDGLALMLTRPEEELAAFEQHASKLREAFARHRDSDDPGVVGGFLQLGKRAPGVAEAPDRAGYWLGLRAAEAWLGAHAEAGLPGLLHAKPAEVLKALE
ncbi:MAG: hypothetical protein R3F30_03620 [Planctomycetota bacterium]